MITAAIDPGKHGLGVAVFRGEDLIWAGFVRIAEELHGPHHLAAHLDRVLVAKIGFKINLAVVEVPQTYTLKHQKGRQQDLVDVALVAGAVGHALHRLGAEVRYPLPAEWKGQLPKEVTATRVMTALSPLEHTFIEQTPRRLLHNVLDAIHLGLRTFTDRRA